MFSTTLAVLRPTPGRVFSASRGARNLTAILVDQLLGERDDVLGLVAIEADRLDVVAHFFFAQGDHFLRCVGDGEQRPRVARLTPTSVACADSTTATSERGRH